MRNDLNKKYRGGYKKRDRIELKKIQGDHNWIWYYRKREPLLPLTDEQRKVLESFLKNHE